MAEPRELNSFDDWVVAEYERTEGFTALVVLFEIGMLSLRPLRSTFLHVIGGEIDWAELSKLLAGAGVKWDGVALFPVSAEEGGPVPDSQARLRLKELTDRIAENRMVVNEGHFFDPWGRRMKVEEAQAQ